MKKKLITIYFVSVLYLLANSDIKIIDIIVYYSSSFGERRIEILTLRGQCKTAHKQENGYSFCHHVWVIMFQWSTDSLIFSSIYSVIYTLIRRTLPNHILALKFKKKYFLRNSRWQCILWFYPLFDLFFNLYYTRCTCNHHSLIIVRQIIKIM